LAPSAPLSPSVVVHPRKIAYLAQHTLFDQIPSLLADFDPPLYAGDKIGSVNAWFGTAGTVTRLHYDSYENLLTQVWGYKYVRLYSQEDSKYLYPIVPAATSTAAAGKGGADAAAAAAPKDATTSQGNVSAVDEDDENRFLSHPLARNARPMDAILGPGDCLYIPARTWHYVRSITPSFSINFWF
jgi:ribosomal protein L16 Arg81 hydroxylase